MRSVNTRDVNTKFKTKSFRREADRCLSQFLKFSPIIAEKIFSHVNVGATVKGSRVRKTPDLVVSKRFTSMREKRAIKEGLSRFIPGSARGLFGESESAIFEVVNNFMLCMARLFRVDALCCWAI